MAVFTKKRDYNTHGHMGKIILDDHLREVVAESGIREGFSMIFVAGCIGALAVTEAEPGILEYDFDHLFSEALGLPYGETFKDGVPYRHHETWHDDNGSSHLRALLLNHSLSIPVLHGEPLLGPWQNIVLVECDTTDRRRTLYYQVHGE